MGILGNLKNLFLSVGRLPSLKTKTQQTNFRVEMDFQLYLTDPREYFNG